MVHDVVYVSVWSRREERRGSWCRSGAANNGSLQLAANEQRYFYCDSHTAHPFTVEKSDVARVARVARPASFFFELGAESGRHALFFLLSAGRDLLGVLTMKMNIPRERDWLVALMPITQP